ncbi:MAG: methylated-DNA--[protein]-cysteine S-methyltransferase [Solirubrobacterales bacterium]|nr:methylated-DNA--[protein]-cysteine S-methyltransferase [Solirubrobacterales bacterium]
MTRTLYTAWASPLGDLLLQGDERALCAIHLPGRHPDRDGGVTATAPFVAAIEQLEQYFAGTRTAFDLRLDPEGSRFDHAVWRHVSAIPYGQTSSYAQIAHAMRRPDRARAVGAANARNPLPIIVPCHRVIGSDGSLTGYAGGLDRKRALLTLEQGAWQERLL